jgi:copper(I)-binding protein
MRTVLLILAAAALHAADAVVTVTGAFSRASAPSAANGVVFCTLAGGPDELVSVTSPAAEHVEMHTVVALDGGAKRMTPVERIPVPGVLKPGGYHLMLMGLKKPLVEGGTITLHLTYAKAGASDAVVPIAGIAAMEAPAAEPDCCLPK